jgi:hypothetical protein
MKSLFSFAPRGAALQQTNARRHAHHASFIFNFRCAGYVIYFCIHAYQ